MPTDLEATRLRLSRSTDASKKSNLGQFLTPEATARFMAGLFPPGSGRCWLLDAGAGIGSLSVAFLKRWQHRELGFSDVNVDAFEIDPALHASLAEALAGFANDSVQVQLHFEDFIHVAADAVSAGMFSQSLPAYTHAILNPPYKKISSESPHRRALRRVGIETVNLYSAFVALAIALVQPGGHIVAIIPRSFCNGPYYRPFRNFLLERVAIRRIHLFESRNSAFKDDAVLQENVILHLERQGVQGAVEVSVSTDDSFADIRHFEHPFQRIVFPDDPDKFIHVPSSDQRNSIEGAGTVQSRLAELGLTVSTGPVVDFRLKEHLRSMPGSQTAPLLYPGHFVEGRTVWPIADFKKSNAICDNSETRKWLYPNGHYCVVRRFSSKEEKRRVVASVVDPRVFNGSEFLGFENHLNLFHERGHGLPEPLAHGLALFLNTTAVDEVFRRFNGHTQVNATDLRLMKYPGRALLFELGIWAMEQGPLQQSQIDEKFRAVIE